MFKAGDKVRITRAYIDDPEDPEWEGIEGMVGTILERMSGHAWPLNTFRVQFEAAKYHKDYWIMFEKEIELVED